MFMGQFETCFRYNGTPIFFREVHLIGHISSSSRLHLGRGVMVKVVLSDQRYTTMTCTSARILRAAPSPRVFSGGRSEKPAGRGRPIRRGCRVDGTN